MRAKLWAAMGCAALVPLLTPAWADSPAEYTYPRLSLGTYFARDWADKPGYGLEFLYQFGEIYTFTLSAEILDLKQRAVNDGHEEWAQHVKFIYLINMSSTDLRRHRPFAENWEVESVASDLTKAIDAAVYYNSLEGADWILRDIYGDPIKTWGGYMVGINTTPSCPKGKWDGKILFNGEEIDLGVGSTIGLTFHEWLAGPLTNTVIRNSLFTQAYDGIHAEDTPSAWLYTFQGQTPDPLRDGVGMTGEELAAYCAETWPYLFRVFFRNLHPDWITRVNGHGMRYYLQGEEDPFTYYREGAVACKLEDYGRWSGWPNYYLPDWIRVYIAVEEMYHPISGAPDHAVYDSMEGWDRTCVQSEPRFSWTQETRDRYSRMALSATLMGDGFWDGFSYEEDFFFIRFLREGMPQYAPHIIPQAGIQLGKALGGYRVDDAVPDKPVYYRRFQNDVAGHRYTVVHNPWDEEINGIPGKDGRWFYGDWPDGAFSENPLTPPPPVGSSDEPGAARGGGGDFVRPSSLTGAVGYALLAIAWILSLARFATGPDRPSRTTARSDTA